MSVALKKAASPGSSQKTTKKLSSEEKQRLFDLYIMPNLHDIKTLTQRYTNNYQDVEDNYQYCLTQLYSYIGSYNKDQKLSTWLHICVKRACFYQNKRRYEEASHYTDIEMCTNNDIYQNGTNMIADMQFGSLPDNLSDTLYSILLQIPTHRLSPFMFYAQGYRIREITAMEWDLGHLEKRSEDVVKSRIYWAKRELQYKLRAYGITGKNYKGKGND